MGRPHKTEATGSTPVPPIINLYNRGFMTTIKLDTNKITDNDLTFLRDIRYLNIEVGTHNLCISMLNKYYVQDRETKEWEKHEEVCFPINYSVLSLEELKEVITSFKNYLGVEEYNKLLLAASLREYK